MKSFISGLLLGETKTLIITNERVKNLKIFDDQSLYTAFPIQDGDDISVHWKINNPFLYIIFIPIYIICIGSRFSAIHPEFDVNLSLVFLVIAFGASRAVIQIYRPDRIRIQIERNNPSI